jgi:uncharacterized protein (DUF58 family)
MPGHGPDAAGVDVSVAASGRLRAYVGLGAAGLLLALLLGRPEPAVLAAPLLGVAAVALALWRPPRLEAWFELDRERAVEGDLVPLRITVTAGAPVPAGSLRFALPGGLALEPAGPLHFAGPRTELAAAVRCLRWGGYAVGRMEVEAVDRVGMFRFEQSLDLRRPFKVYPRAERIRRALPPQRTQALAGNQVARLRGDGIEFADIRAFIPGDVVRRVNWRATARRGELHVNQMHLERNADVVIFLDTFTELRGAGGSTFELAVRGAAALIDRYLEQRDRVGLVAFGGTLRWLRPAMGEVQLYRLVDSLIDTEVVMSYAWKGLEVIPRRTLPPGSLVIAFTPLLDDRSVGALADLRGRGHDLAIVEIRVEAWTRPGAQEADVLAYRLWEMEREALRARFRQMGVAVAGWRPGEGLQDVLEELREFRRHARRLRA